MSQHVISVKVENKFGVLARVAGLFSARGYNIDSLAVSETELPDVSVMTIVVSGDDRIIEQVKKQLNKLIDIIKVTDHNQENAVQREIVLAKLNATPTKRNEIYQLAQIFGARIVGVTNKAIILEMVSDPETVDNFIELLRPYAIKELIRTGRVSILKE
ncbi:MAG: acetolactate synthase small subunit [Spirochaetes bacterium]|jgi:acetolactate synthase-1/3 small subunit|nr:acetolactate synthase small subunit [Spirochaetota bacterium]MBP8986876.1 acetolactate synthase small subunit [Spirochaetota bacterium]HQL42910.1 acetolactate synthase small subunit [Spirochaetota bacterium]HQQ51020.1 acetolactate synthase small subunit [Spirochaetota bacterium]